MGGLETDGAQTAVVLDRGRPRPARAAQAHPAHVPAPAAPLQADEQGGRGQLSSGPRSAQGSRKRVAGQRSAASPHRLPTLDTDTDTDIDTYPDTDIYPDPNLTRRRLQRRAIPRSSKKRI